MIKKLIQCLSQFLAASLPDLLSEGEKAALQKIFRLFVLPHQLCCNVEQCDTNDLLAHGCMMSIVSPPSPSERDKLARRSSDSNRNEDGRVRSQFQCL